MQIITYHKLKLLNHFSGIQKYCLSSRNGIPYLFTLTKENIGWCTNLISFFLPRCPYKAVSLHFYYVILYLGTHQDDSTKCIILQEALHGMVSLSVWHPAQLLDLLCDKRCYLKNLFTHLKSMGLKQDYFASRYFSTEDGEKGENCEHPMNLEQWTYSQEFIISACILHTLCQTLSLLSIPRIMIPL